MTPAAPGPGATEVGSLVELLTLVQAGGFTAVQLGGVTRLPLEGRYRAHDERWGEVELAVYTATDEWVHLGVAWRAPVPVLAQE
ncbi:hypothetical protein [Deinococcus rufus]|uniref:Uncharacterized protein n=1 Tax=Deinococcus rufus TaxID=2136097 RepID=A0ABV7Z7N6_9DEIO